MAGNNSLFKSAEYLKDSIASAMSSNTMVLRVRRDLIIRRLSANQERLVDLRYNEVIINARIHSSVDFSSIKAKFGAGTTQTVSPLQGMAPLDTNLKGDHPSVAYSIAQIERSLPGFKEKKSEVDRISSEIQMLAQKINADNKELQDIESKLSSQNPTNITLSKMEADKVIRSSYSSLFFLYQLAKKYRDLTPEEVLPGADAKGFRQFPDNDPLRAKNLMRLMQSFNSSLTSWPQHVPFIDQNDPGSDKNITYLETQMSIMQNTMNDKTDLVSFDKKAQKHAAVLNSTLQDTFDSEGISRQAPPPVPPTNSVAAQTNNYVTANINFFGNVYGVGKIPYDSIGGALLASISKMHKNEVGALSTLPVCNPEAKVLTEADKILAAQSMRDAVAQGKAQEDILKRNEAAKAASSTFPILPMMTIPVKWWEYYDGVVGPLTSVSSPNKITVPQEVVFPNDPVTQRVWIVTTAVEYTLADSSNVASSLLTGYPEAEMHKGDPIDLPPQEQVILVTKDKRTGKDVETKATQKFPVYLLKYVELGK